VKSYIPGTMSSLYLEELKRLQSNFLASITEPPEETLRRDILYNQWVESTFKRDHENARGSI
jgi:hypothetical protein